jgi:hypothetical protein
MKSGVEGGGRRDKIKNGSADLSGWIANNLVGSLWHLAQFSRAAPHTPQLKLPIRRLSQMEKPRLLVSDREMSQLDERPWPVE